MSVESRTRAGQPAGQTCQQCRGDLERDDPRDGGSDPTTTHEGYRCPECGAAGALVVRDGVVIDRPDVDALTHRWSLNLLDLVVAPSAKAMVVLDRVEQFPTAF